MERQNQFSIIADQTAGRYVEFLQRTLSLYNTFILSRELNPKSISSFSKELNNFNKLYLEKEVNETMKLYEQLNSFIDEDTKHLGVKVTEDNDWSLYLSENINFLFEAIKLQSTKDVLYASNFFRTKLIEIVSMNKYEMAYNLIFNSKELDFHYTDKIGRKIQSVKYIRTITRDFVIKNYNDMIVGSAILNGIEKATIQNISDEHKDHNKIVFINKQNDINYFDIRNEIFHPNTNSILRL